MQCHWKNCIIHCDALRSFIVVWNETKQEIRKVGSKWSFQMVKPLILWFPSLNYQPFKVTILFIDSIALSSVVIHINSKLIIFHFIISSLNHVIYVIELSKQEITNCIETNFQNYDSKQSVWLKTIEWMQENKSALK